MKGSVADLRKHLPQFDGQKMYLLSEQWDEVDRLNAQDPPPPVLIPQSKKS